jgi:hypothetical protein
MSNYRLLTPRNDRKLHIYNSMHHPRKMKGELSTCMTIIVGFTLDGSRTALQPSSVDLHPWRPFTMAYSVYFDKFYF